ncbi:hypothetical protein [Egicoccus sp. AB-alg6-2]|uniref:hypothetical protein n=1 Tax=Egicoccus sp. AB-alg6-2 TaxID=3242692 RepID=UPI00359E22C8
MTSHHEEFADPVVIPGPNLRSLFTDTEDAIGDAVVMVESDDARSCPVCHRAYGSTTLVCHDDGAALIEQPPRP